MGHPGDGAGLTGDRPSDDGSPPPNRMAAVNVDVDSLYLYYQIHGLSAAEAGDAVWERGVPRFAALFEEAGVRGTFFVVGSDLERWPEARRLTRELAEAGHEIGSHSWSHPYDLVRRSPEEIADELDRAQAVITEVVGRPAVGFRAPGYTLTPEL
ncbi:MAG: polysaccharide deacetylase family protein, partial [Myxococcota bacterium]|nr:polysaccharide deacetylase family protein [Myxococcota bacterium]